MIKIDDKFSIKRDKRQWILIQHYPGKDKYGNAKTHQRESYHGSIDQISNHILNVLGERCEKLEELEYLYSMQTRKLSDLITKG